MAVRVYKAAGVKREEHDVSQTLVPTGVSDGGTVIRSRKGPINRIVQVSDDTEFIDSFGEPYFLSGDNAINGQNDARRGLVPEFGYGAYGALEYLKESDTLYVVRGYEDTDQFASVEVFNNLNLSAYTETETSATNTTLSYWQPVSAGDSDSTTPDKEDYISAIEYWAVNRQWLNGPLLVAATSPGEDGNDVAVTIESFSLSADWRYRYDSYPSQTSATVMSGDTSAVAANFPIANKVFKVNVFVKGRDSNWEDFVDSTTPALSGLNALRIAPVETFYGTLGPQLDVEKRELNIESVINGNSKYIYVKSNTAYTRFSYNERDYLFNPNKEDTIGDYVYLNQLVQLKNGVQKMDTGLGSTTGWSLFEERENAYVSILLCPDYSTVVKQEVGRIAAKRMDCIAVFQTGELTDSDSNSIIAKEDYGYMNPSYVALYAGYSQVYDRYNDKKVYLPNSIFGGMAMARTDRIANPWDAPAGITRATLSVLDQRKTFGETAIGKIYERNINPVALLRGTGYVIWGQKTAQQVASSLDRIQVRRNLLFIENNIERSLVNFVFENNTVKTRLRVFSLVDTFLGGVLAGGGLYDYDVTVDETNNTNEVIDAHQMMVDIVVQPVKAAEFVVLRTTITRTGVSIEEIRAAA